MVHRQVFRGELPRSRRMDRILGEAHHHAAVRASTTARTTWACTSAHVLPGRLGQRSGDEEARDHDARLPDRRLRRRESRRRSLWARIRESTTAKSSNVDDPVERFRLALVRPRADPLTDNYSLIYSLASAYEPPEILKRIATDRSQPVHPLRTQANAQPLAFLR